MKYNNDTLRIIKEQATAENHRLCTAKAVINEMFADGKITMEEVESIVAAAQPYIDKSKAIADAAHHALTNALTSPMMLNIPGFPAPKPLTAEEEALLDQAAIDYFPAH